MTFTADVVVLGAGVVGASVACHLARAGSTVVLVERDGRAGESATHNSAGQVRLHHSDPADALLSTLSLRYFESWSQTIGGDVGFRRTGFAFLVGERHVDLLARNVKGLTELGVTTSLLTPDQFGAEHPTLDLDGVAALAYEPRSGYADPVRANEALLSAARRRGAMMVTSPRGARLRRSGGRVVGVETGAETILCGEVVLAAGAWSAQLVPELRLPLRTKRISLCVAAGAGLTGGRGLPMVIDDVLGGYFRPDGADRVLFGVPLGQWDVEPGAASAPPEPEPVAAARALIARRLPGLARAAQVSVAAAADGYTPDGRALIGRTEKLGQLYVCTGFNGGGLKVAPAVGEAVAAELTGRVRRAELEPYRPDRFADDQEPPIARPVRYAHM